MTRPTFIISQLSILSLAICLLMIIPSQSQVVSKVITADVMQNLLKIADDHFFFNPIYTVPIKKFLRAAFHDCMGGCDGAIDTYNTENRGLEDFAKRLNHSYEKSSNSSYIK